MRRRNEKDEIFYVIAQNWLHDSPDWKGSLSAQNNEWKKTYTKTHYKILKCCQRGDLKEENQKQILCKATGIQMVLKEKEPQNSTSTKVN